MILPIQDLTGSGNQSELLSIRLVYGIPQGRFLIAWAATLGAYIWQGDVAFLNQHIFKVRVELTGNFTSSS